ncbi:phage shock protein G [Vibrio sp. MACH09]|uniref:envelope stress response protein PspG n=1 Tax=unclassified Vibrio TaxID=2614977 RepID=UPI001493A59F|nr:MULTISPECIES: envelope stress response protein PspG [unclassified Vibrio]NOI68305.1 envelope stress response protein PspG [Vibrio sp. 99-8-1]GLO59736.1 phage shock protein G [Vibrio sp. MACH09]
MFELLFLFVFLGVLFFTGVTMVTIFLAIGISIFMMFLMGMLGFALKLLPWLIVIALGVWFYKNYVITAR